VPVDVLLAAHRPRHRHRDRRHQQNDQERGAGDPENDAPGPSVCRRQIGLDDAFDLHDGAHIADGPVMARRVGIRIVAGDAGLVGHPVRNRDPQDALSVLDLGRGDDPVGFLPEDLPGPLLERVHRAVGPMRPGIGADQGEAGRLLGQEIGDILHEGRRQGDGTGVAGMDRGRVQGASGGCLGHDVLGVIAASDLDLFGDVDIAAVGGVDRGGLHRLRQIEPDRADADGDERDHRADQVPDRRGAPQPLVWGGSLPGQPVLCRHDRPATQRV